MPEPDQDVLVPRGFALRDIRRLPKMPTRRAEGQWTRLAVEELLTSRPMATKAWIDDSAQLSESRPSPPRATGSVRRAESPVSATQPRSDRCKVRSNRAQELCLVGSKFPEP